MIRTAATFAALALTASTGVALGQSASPSPASSFSPLPTAVKAAKDATNEAKTVTYAIMARGGSHVQYGTVTLQRIGGTRSRVRVELTQPPPSGTALSIRPGSDCTSPRVANAPHSILLNPFTGRVSETVVNLPLTNLQSGNYLVDMQNATAQQQSIDACARLNAGQP